MTAVSADPSMISRVARVLRAFDADATVLKLPELTSRAGLPSSTVHRIATALAEEGLLDRTDGGYSVGSALWEVGELAPVSALLRETALPHMMTLYEETHENVHLAILDGHDALYVGRVTGVGSIPTLSRMGGRLPLHTTGVGKALLMGRDEAWLSDYFRRPRERETTHSITEESALRSDVAEARQRGWAIARQEMTLGNVSIAAPLAPIPGLPPAAVGVVVHVARAGERLGRSVLRAARSISDDLASR